MTATFLPITVPTAIPVNNKAEACIKTGYGKFIYPSVVKRPLDIPIRPKALPIRAVCYEASPAIPPIQQREAPR